MKNIIKNIKKTFGFFDEKQWLTDLIVDLEQKILAEENLPFRIKQIKDRGFVIQTNGLFGYISFSHMPWRYEDLGSWKHVFEYLQKKTFFCRILKFKKSPLSIMINGKIPQFKKMTLLTNAEYKGIIVKKTRFYMFVDFGYHFNWKCGSFVEMIQKETIGTDIFKNLQCGEVFNAVYTGKSKENFDTSNHENEINLEDFIGQSVEVQISTTFNNQIIYLVEGQFRGTIPVAKGDYSNRRKKLIKEAIPNLEDGDIIHCEVTNTTRGGTMIELKWPHKHEINNVLRRAIAYNLRSRLDDEMLKKLKLAGENINKDDTSNNENEINLEEFIGQSVRVQVSTTLNNKKVYLVEGQFRGTIPVANGDYSTRRKRLIKEAIPNLEDGDIIHCEVTNIAKAGTLIELKWPHKHEIENVLRRAPRTAYNLQSRLDDDVLEKLKLAGKDNKDKSDKESRYILEDGTVWDW